VLHHGENDMGTTATGVGELADLHHALARAGTLGERATQYRAEALGDGRMGASVTRWVTDAADGERRSVVLKVVPAASWRASLGLDGIEARLWSSGATRVLPAGLRCPTLDVGRHPERGDWWILMEDVSHGIMSRGLHDQARADRLMRSVARLHARYWGRDAELAALPLPSFETGANALASLTVHVARGEASDEPWLSALAQDFWVCRALLPAFLDALRPADADFYVQLCADHGRIAAALARHPHTFVHGDLRRANIAFVGDDVVLFDWEHASHGPAARDLAWYFFLRHWAYPPAAGCTPADRRGGLGVYLEALERELGRPVDRAGFGASCELAELSVLCQLGFCLADPLTEASAEAAAIERAEQTMADAIERARRLHEAHFG
jgi:hypothetical protein